MHFLSKYVLHADVLNGCENIGRHKYFKEDRRTEITLVN